MRSYLSRNGSAVNGTARLANQPRLKRAQPKPAQSSPPSPDTFSRHLVIMVSQTPFKGHASSEAGARSRYRLSARAIYDRLGRDRRWQTTLAITPDTAVASPVWPADAMRMPQGGGDVAQRIKRVLRDMPPGPVVIIGTDVSNVQPRDVWTAFALLGEADAVLGPGADGGFWLIGAKRRPNISVRLDTQRWASMATRASAKRALSARRIKELAPLTGKANGRANGRRIVSPLA